MGIFRRVRDFFGGVRGIFGGDGNFWKGGYVGFLEGLGEVRGFFGGVGRGTWVFWRGWERYVGFLEGLGGGKHAWVF